jgi:hypothetical protein
VLPNHAKVAGFYTFGTGAGWRLDAADRKFKVLLMWNFIGPPSRDRPVTCRSLLGLGEYLPSIDSGASAGVGTWIIFGRPAVKDVVRSRPGARAAGYRQRHRRSMAPPKSRDAFIAGFRTPRAKRSTSTKNVLASHDRPHGYFEQDAVPLWIPRFVALRASSGRSPLASRPVAA